MSDGESLDSYLAKFFRTMNNLKSLYEDVYETRIVQKLLMSPSRRFSPLCPSLKKHKILMF